jgi:DNA polymerase-3 subunit epsilon
MEFKRLRRAWYAKKLAGHPAAEFFKTPLPSKRAFTHDIEFLAVDIETTDLDPARGEIVSIGWVPMIQGSIILSQARHIVLGIRKEIGQSAIFHNIRDVEVEMGERATAMVEALMQAAKGRVLVFHNANIDMAYINKLSRRLAGVPVICRILDTMLWEKQKIVSKYHHIPTDTLRLHNCRRRYNLPDYPAHNALSDALATLELLQAQISYLGHNARLGEVISKAGY